MQIAIKPEEKETLTTLVKPLGRSQWFAGIAGFSRNTLTKLKEQGMADEKIVEKMRAALQRKEVRELIRMDKAVA